METQIIITLILTILILLFLGRHRAGTFRKKEARLNATVIKQKSELRDLESRLDLRTKQYRQFQKKTQTASEQQTENPPIYNEPPPEIFHENAYWKALSDWYRKEQDWMCENCGIDLSSKKNFLDAHHIRGRAYNSPENLKALCVECHSDQTQPIDHSFMKESLRYQDFMKWRVNTRRT